MPEPPPAPGEALERLRFVVASCSHYEAGYFSAYRHMAAEDPDLVLFLGDYIYESNLEGRALPRRCGIMPIRSRRTWQATASDTPSTGPIQTYRRFMPPPRA